MAQFEIQEDLRADVRVVAITGDFDIANTDRASEVLGAAVADRGHPLVVDLTACDFIDSAGLSTLLAKTRPRVSDGDIAVAVGAHTETRRMLDLTGISLTLPTFDTADAAAAAVQG